MGARKKLSPNSTPIIVINFKQLWGQPLTINFTYSLPEEGIIGEAEKIADMVWICEVLGSLISPES
jgi:hypothetical protein